MLHLDLGKALAIAYAREKGKIINLSRNPIKIKNLNEELKKINNIDNIGYSVDVSNYDEVFNIKNNLLRENNLPDIIINNAAGNFLCSFEDLTPNGWKRINDIVLNGAFNIYHILEKHL